MISKDRLKKLKEILLFSKNPVFLFDNDPDGICSTSILIRNIGKGNAFVLKSIEKISENLSKKIFSVYPSEIFIIDKPIRDLNFIKKTKEKNVPLIYIDHHEQKESNYCVYFNSYPSSEPVSFITQKIFDSKETRFLSLMGCISDSFLPDFYEEEKNKFPELFLETKDAFEIFYKSDFGKAIQIISLSLMNNDKVIEKILDYLKKINSPYEILIENEKNRFMHERYNEMIMFIEKNIEKTKEFDELIFLEFSGKYSLVSELANRLKFMRKNKFIVVCYKKEDSINISLRGKRSKKIVQKVLGDIENSFGGGHEMACGLRIPSSEYDKFKKIISEIFFVEI